MAGDRYVRSETADGLRAIDGIVGRLGSQFDGNRRCPGPIHGLSIPAFGATIGRARRRFQTCYGRASTLAKRQESVE